MAGKRNKAVWNPTLTMLIRVEMEAGDEATFSLILQRRRISSRWLLFFWRLLAAVFLYFQGSLLATSAWKPKPGRWMETH